MLQAQWRKPHRADIAGSFSERMVPHRAMQKRISLVWQNALDNARIFRGSVPPDYRFSSQSRPRLEEETPMRVYYDRDADLNLIKGKKVVIVGYGSQGHAHALNLKDSGVKDVAIARREGSASAKKAEAAGFKVMEVAEAAKWAALVMMLTTDELQGDIYHKHLHDNMKKGAALVFAHGLYVHFNQHNPHTKHNKQKNAPKNPSHTVRSE